MIPIGKTDKKNGFTLIEFVTVFVILSVVSAMTAMGFVSMIHGYVLTKKNAEVVQDAEIILTRLAKELQSTTSITSGNQTSITFDSISAASPVVLSWSGDTRKLSFSTAADVDVLGARVASFSLKYLDKYDSTEGDTYTPASTAIIKITLSLTGADDVTATFEDRVYLNGVMTGT
ncbi:MAG: type II secretion system protein [Mangrovibacterium sp.]|nr:type II secretion system protein [Mangrovibacterium sp.]HOG06789.1 type II secretion system protein [Syntrophales bacterium]HOS76944.1 type II secretion system protein [Syntrophales bacterium]